MICAARRSNAQQFGWLTKCHLEPCWINQCWWYLIWRWYPISRIRFEIYLIGSIFCFSCSCKRSTLISLSNPSKVFFLYLNWFYNFFGQNSIVFQRVEPNLCSKLLIFAFDSWLSSDWMVWSICMNVNEASKSVRRRQFKRIQSQSLWHHPPLFLFNAIFQHFRFLKIMSSTILSRGCDYC